MTNLQEHKVFWGPITELIERARLASKAINISPVKLTDRLIRYYSAQGVLDKPDRLGRDAAYNFRHLLQLLTARRLSSKGISLEIIGRHNLSTTTDQLHEDLFKPVAVEDFIPREKTEDGLSGALIKQVVGTPVALVDLLSEVRSLSDNLKKDREDLRWLRDDLSGVTMYMKELDAGFRSLTRNFEMVASMMNVAVDKIHSSEAKFEFEINERFREYNSRFDHVSESIERLEKSLVMFAASSSQAK
jgi:DNA-binding transcriptional MerR regulator